MRILAIGDLHGKFSEKLRKRLKKEEFDFILSVGDFSGVDEFYPFLIKLFKAIKKGEPTLSFEEYFGKKKLKELIRKDDLGGRKVMKELSRDWSRPA